MADDELLTMDEAISRLSTTRGTFYRWLRSGKIKGFKVGRQWRFRPDEIDRFLSGNEPSIDLPVSPASLVRDLEQVAGDLPDAGPTDTNSAEYIVRLMLICALRRGAMSLFIDAVASPTEVRGSFSLRIDGLVYNLANYDIRLHQPIVVKVKQLGGMDVTERRKPQDGRIGFRIAPDRSVDFVVNTIPSTLGESCSLLVRDPRAAQVSLKQLGLTGPALHRVKTALTRRQGLCVACGPAESGKTVTAYSMLNAIDTTNKRVLSIDEPGCVSIPGIIQTVAESFDVSISAMVRAATRQNWDVLNIGHIEDSETLSLALREALTGKVITSMHTKDAISCLLTIREWGGEDMLLADALAMITSQRLVRRLCDDCRAPVDVLSADDKALIDAVSGAHGLQSLDGSYYEAVGCSACNEGYVGRIGLFEALVPTPSLESALMGGADHAALRRLAFSEGMESLCLDGIRKAAAGITSVRELRRVTFDLLSAFGV